MNKASTHLTVWWARLSFPKVWRPEQIQIGGRPKGDPKFSACIVIPNSQAEMIKQIQAAEKEIIAKAWPDNDAPGKFHHALQNGSVARPNDPNLADAWIINAYASADSPPDIVESGTSPGQYIRLDAEKDQQKVYSGAEAHVSIGLFAYQSTANEGGIGAGLNVLCMTGREFPRFDNRQTAASAFGTGPSSAPPPPPEPGPGAPPSTAPDMGPDDTDTFADESDEQWFQ